VPPDPATAAELDRIEVLIDRWLERQLADNDVVAAVDRDPQARRWFVRMAGDEKDTFSVWLTLDQRTLHYETFLMPAPEENHGRLYEHLLRRNSSLYGVSLAIGAEDAIFLVGQLDVRHLDDDELDRVLGTLYAHTEQFFRPAMRLGYESKFRG
jgi:hypothetical protein